MPVLEYDRAGGKFWFYAPQGTGVFPGAYIDMAGGRKFVFDDITPTNYTNIKQYKLMYMDSAKVSKDALARINELKEEQDTAYTTVYRDLLAGKPYDHQVATIERMQKSDRLALLLEQGLGKTYIALMSMRIFKARDGQLKALVMCPSIVFASWLAEAAKFAPELKVVTYRGNLFERLATQERLSNGEPFDILLTTYDMLRDAKNKSHLLYSGIAFSRLDEETKTALADTLFAHDEKARKHLLADIATLKPTRRKQWYPQTGKYLADLNGAKHKAVMSLYPEIAKHIRAYAAAQKAVLAADDAVGFFNTLGLTVTVFDEASRLVSPKSHQAKVVENLQTKRMYMMSGTLCVGRPTDVYQPFRILNPNILGQNWYAFQNKYCVFNKYNKHIIESYKNVDELKRKLEPYTIDYVREDCLDLPDRTIVTCYYEVDDATKALYNSIITNKTVTVNNKEINCGITLQKMQKCLQVLSGFVHYMPAENLCGMCDVNIIEKCVYSNIRPNNAKCLRHTEFRDLINKQSEVLPLTSCPKLDMLKEDLHNITGTEKVIIWAWYRHDLANIAKLLADMSIPYITADEKGCAQTFEANNNIRVFLGQTAQGIGITLNSATTTIYYSHGMGLEARLQSMDRNMRIGQTKPIVVRDYVCAGSLEANIVDLLQHKEDVKDFMQRNTQCLLCSKMQRCRENGVTKYGKDCIYYEDRQTAEKKLSLELALLT